MKWIRRVRRADYYGIISESKLRGLSLQVETYLIDTRTYLYVTSLDDIYTGIYTKAISEVCGHDYIYTTDIKKGIDQIKKVMEYVEKSQTLE